MFLGKVLNLVFDFGVDYECQAWCFGWHRVQRGGVGPMVSMMSGMASGTTP